MEIRIDQSLQSYVDATNETAKELLDSDSPLVRIALRPYEYFQTVLWADAKGLNPFVALLSMQAVMLYLAGVRIALGGHFAAIFPTMRTALEAACYAHKISQDNDLASVWLDRHESREAMKACRKHFGSAVSDVVRELEAVAEGNGSWIQEAYDEAIHHGGHPNVKAILQHSRINEADDKALVSLVGLHGPNGFQTHRGLLAGAEYGLAIAVVLTNTLDEADEKHLDFLKEFNDEKIAVATALENGEYAQEC